MGRWHLPSASVSTFRKVVITEDYAVREKFVHKITHHWEEFGISLLDGFSKNASARFEKWWGPGSHGVRTRSSSPGGSVFVAEPTIFHVATGG